MSLLPKEDGDQLLVAGEEGIWSELAGGCWEEVWLAGGEDCGKKFPLEAVNPVLFYILFYLRSC